MPQDPKVRENRLRRMAARQLLRLEKSRRRDELAHDFGGWMVADIHTNTALLGTNHYDATLDDVEAFLKGRRSAGRMS